MNIIKEIIENGNLEEAKNKIRKLEEKAADEKSIHIQASLLRQIHELKQMYISKTTINLNGLEKNNNQAPSIKIIPEFDGNNSKLILSKVISSTIDECICTESKIEACNDIIIKGIVCKNSILIISVTESTIRCSAQQIRLIGCRNIKLDVYTETGIFLENCSNIQITEALFNNQSREKNMFREVFDFSNPNEAINYEIIEKK